MSEMTMNMGSMYEEVPEIQKLNRVEGFDPRRYMRTIQDEGQPARDYLAGRESIILTWRSASSGSA